jgi:hypothetical protein
MRAEIVGSQDDAVPDVRLPLLGLILLGGWILKVRRQARSVAAPSP